MSTHNVPIFNIKKNSKLSQICSYRIFSKGLKNKFETAVVNEPSVFEPLKFYCIFIIITNAEISCQFWKKSFFFSFNIR